MDKREPRQVLTFSAGGEVLAIDVGRVSEVLATPPITRVPNAPLALKGLTNVRGQVTPVLSVGRELKGDETAGSHLIILAGENPVGLSVDGIGTLESFAKGDAEVASTSGARLFDVEALLPKTLANPHLRKGAAHDGRRTLAAKETKVEAEGAFLAFELSGQIYAFPLEEVSAVRSLPDEVTRLPKSQEVMLGLAPVGGRLLPVVSIAGLLGLSGRGASKNAIVVVRLGASEVGLLVDQVRGVLRIGQSLISPVPALLNRGVGEARIDSVARTEQGLVSILSAERIFAEATVADVLAEQGEHEVDQSPTDLKGDLEQFILFRLGEETYGLPISAVEEVVRLPEKITRAPRAPAYVRGVINHRGAAIPLIDQGQRFNVPGEARRDDQRRVMVVRLPDLVVGFVVDGVEEILSAASGDLSQAPAMLSGEASLFDRVVHLERDGRMILLIDPRELLDQAERSLVKDLAATSEQTAS